MVISVFSLRRVMRLSALIALGVVGLALPSRADDEITKKDGTIIRGQIISVSSGQVMVSSKTSSGGTAKVPYYITDIKSISMAPPAAITQLPHDAAPAAVVAALEPLVKQFAGLPADWVVNAMAQLAEADIAAGQSDKAGDIYNQIILLYPGSAYQNEAIAGQAKMKLLQGKTAEALAAVQPIVDKANQNLAPSATEGGLYASAFLVYGQALEAQKKYPQALEAYLTVKTMFYQNPAMVEQAEQLAQKLRDKNPGVGVD